MNFKTVIWAGVATMVVAALLAGCADTPESLLASAKQSLGRKDRAAAIIQLRNALQKNGELAEARYLLGVSLIDTGDLAGAEKELRRASDLKYDADKVVPAIARALVLRGEPQKALDEFATATLTAPEARADLQTTLGRARMATGNSLDAGSDFAAALAARPDYPPALIGEARLKAAAGDLPAALALVEAALAIDAELTEGWQLKGDLANVQRERARAVEAYRKAIATKPNDVQARYMVVALLIRDGKLEEAGKELAEMKKVAPKHRQTFFLQALLSFREGNLPAARDAIQLHLKAAPNSLLGLLLGAQIDYRLGNYGQAETVLQAILKSLPNQPVARSLLVQTYLRQGKPAKALEVLKPMLADEKLDSDKLALAGEVFIQNGDAASAAQYFEKAAALDPKNTDKRTAVALSHLAKGERDRGLEELEAVAGEDTWIRADLALVAANMRQKKYDAALESIAAIEKKLPDKPFVHNLRGGALLAKGDVAGARRSLERALEMDPTYFAAAANLARMDMRDKKPEDAKKRFEGILAKDPKNTRALLALAGLRAQAGGSPGEVAALIGKAIAANPTDVEARLTLISLWIGKDPKKAVAAAQDALTALPDRPEILDAAGKAYRAAGDTNQALTTYNKLAQVRPDSPLPYLRLAELQRATKDNTGARESLRKALASKPDLIEAQRAVITLDLVEGKINDALAVARDVQKQRPKKSEGYLLEGRIYAAKKAWTEAATAYRTGLKQAGTTDLAVYLHAALGASGKRSEADSFASTWLKDHPQDNTFREYLAQTAIEKKDYAGAAKQYKTMLGAQPDDPAVLNNLAWVSGQMKDPKALEYAEKADRIAPNTPDILDTYGMLLAEAGETARGVELLRRAVTLAPNSAQIRLNLASALVKSGQKEEAKKELDAVAKLGGKYVGQAETVKMMLGL